MPCNSDYMDATSQEVSLSQVECIFDELDGIPFNKSARGGYHPRAYCKTTKELLDTRVAALCKRLKELPDITKYSLEVQIWWRDHQKADKKRLSNIKD